MNRIAVSCIPFSNREWMTWYRSVDLPVLRAPTRSRISHDPGKPGEAFNALVKRFTKPPGVPALQGNPDPPVHVEDIVDDLIDYNRQNTDPVILLPWQIRESGPVFYSSPNDGD